MDTYERALTMVRETDDEYGEAMMLVNVGARLIKTGHRRDGIAFLERAESLAQELGVMGERLQARAASLLAAERPASREWGRSSTRPTERPVPVRTAGQRPVATREPVSRAVPNDVFNESSQFMTR
jgi:hypothetical protein